jgi:hypothetical protein
MYPVYVRGEAYLAAKRGTEAVAEFQKFPARSSAELTHRGNREVGIGRGPMRCREILRGFSHVVEGRGWDVPVLAAAKAEYAKFK